MILDTGEQDSYRKKISPSSICCVKRRGGNNVSSINLKALHQEEYIPRKKYLTHFETTLLPNTTPLPSTMTLKKLLKHVTKRIPTAANEAFDCPIQQEELQ
jgi:hypothetical protein